jgi:hypothetical protein
MTTILVNTISAQEVRVEVNGSVYFYPRGSSRADYSITSDSISLQCSPLGLNLVFASSSYDFLINGVPYVGAFVTLAQIFNDDYFSSTSVSPPPVEPPVAMRANAILTGAYVATNSVKATGRQLLNVDFTITNGGALADNGNVIAILEVSDDNLNWVTPNNVVAKGNLHADGAATPYSDGTVFRNLSAEIPAYEIPYDATGLPPNPIRISFATGYGFYYRFQVRASVPSGVQGGAPATFPDLEITATLQ